MSNVRQPNHQKNRSWGSFNRQSRPAKKPVDAVGYNNNVQTTSHRKASTKPPSNNRSQKERGTPPRMARRNSEGDRRTYTTSTLRASPKCLPGLGGHSLSPRTVIRPSLFCSASRNKQFVPLDDNTFSTIARQDPNINSKTNNTEHYTQIWLTNQRKEEEYAKKKWGVSARNHSAERIIKAGLEDESNWNKDLREKRCRTSSERVSILDREIEHLARALHQSPSKDKNAKQQRQNPAVTFDDERSYTSTTRTGDQAPSASVFPVSAEFDVIGDCSHKNTNLEHVLGSSEFQKKAFAETKIFSEKSLSHREMSAPPRRSLLIEDEQESLYVAPNNTTTQSIFRPKVCNGGARDIREEGGRKNHCHEEKKEVDHATAVQETKLDVQNQALFRPEGLDFYRDWTTEQPGVPSLGCSFDEHLAKLKIDSQEDTSPEEMLRRDYILFHQKTFSEESNAISEITETCSKEQGLNQITKDYESSFQRNENACKKAKCYVFHNKPFSASEEQSKGAFPTHVKGMVARLENLNRLEAGFAEEFGYKDFIPIQDQKKKEANLRLRLLNGFAEDAFTDGDDALNYMNGQSFSFEHESRVVISPVD